MANLTFRITNTYAWEERKSIYHDGDNNFNLRGSIWGENSVCFMGFQKSYKIRHTQLLRMHGHGKAKRVHELLRNPTIEVAVLGNSPIL